MYGLELPLTRRELSIATRLEARGEQGLFDSLVKLRGTPLSDSKRLGRLHAVGGEGVIYEVEQDSVAATRLVAKVPLVPWHKPIKLTSKLVRRMRDVVLDEAEVLERAGCPFFPRFEALHTFENPLLETARGGEFAIPEPCLLMERLPGWDLDVWLCRIHRGGIDRKLLRVVLNRLVVGVVTALADLESRGYLYADLRPGNLRVMGRPQRRARLLDAGGCVRADDPDARFPHVPSYLPPRVFRAAEAGEKVMPSTAIMASMAGRTLFEVATGKAPQAAGYVDMMKLVRSPVSPPVAEEIAALANENYPTCAAALEALRSRAKKRIRRKLK